MSWRYTISEDFDTDQLHLCPRSGQEPHDERKRKDKVDNEDARTTKHDCTHTSEEEKEDDQMLIIFRAPKSGIIHVEVFVLQGWYGMVN